MTTTPPSARRWQFWIDRGGTFTDVVGRAPDGALHTVTTVFPSVTGLAYVPFLMGRFPGPVGLPGLRWYDRARARCKLPPFCRSYLSAEMRHLDGDLDAHAPMIFDLVRSRFNAMSMVGRGVKRADRLGRLEPHDSFAALCFDFRGPSRAVP